MSIKTEIEDRIKQARGSLPQWTEKEFNDTFKAVIIQERLYFKCRKCGKKLSGAAKPVKFSLHILKHQFIVDSVQSDGSEK